MASPSINHAPTATGNFTYPRHIARMFGRLELASKWSCCARATAHGMRPDLVVAIEVTIVHQPTQISRRNVSR